MCFNFIQPITFFLPQGAPIFVNKPTDTVAVKDQPIRFECIVDGFPKPKVQWFLNDKEFTAKDTTVKIDACNLSIPKVQSNHLGVFKIKASNSVGSVEHTFELNVIGKWCCLRIFVEF